MNLPSTEQRPEPGDLYRHPKSGGRYEIHMLYNTDSDREGFPDIVAYSNVETGQAYARELSRFLQSMTLETKACDRAKAPCQPSRQERAVEWLKACFGPDALVGKQERVHRFFEEAIELAQAAGCTKHEALQLIDYVFSRPVGTVREEAGDVQTTLAVLCAAFGAELDDSFDFCMDKAWSKIDAIREKRKSKPSVGPLPVPDRPESPTPMVIFSPALRGILFAECGEVEESENGAWVAAIDVKSESPDYHGQVDHWGERIAVRGHNLSDATRLREVVMLGLKRLSGARPEQKCGKCYGLGKLDDADLGDISYRTWDCDKCHGTGRVDG